MQETSKLRWYLFEEYVRMLEEFGYPQTRYMVINDLTHAANLYKKFKLMGKIFWLFTEFKRGVISKRDTTLLLHLAPKKYCGIYQKVSKATNVYSTSVHSLMPKNVFYVPTFSVFGTLYSGILNNNEDTINQSLDAMSHILQKINPDMIVLNNDAPPDTRAIVLVAKKLGVPTVEIQHGIYQSNSLLPTGRYVDYLFVWGVL